MYGSARSVGHVEDTPARSPRLPCTPRMGQGRGSTSSRGSLSRGEGKALSMENIQSLSAAYATSAPVYLSDHQVPSSSSYSKSTMTLGRATGHAPFGRRAAFMGSSPNIGSFLDSLGYGDDRATPLLQLQRHGALSPLLRQVVRGGARGGVMGRVRGEAPAIVEQLKELQRETDLLRRELDVKDGKLCSAVNSIKVFWSPELKKERGMRKEESARMSILKEQMTVMDEENQHLQMTIQALQEELHTQRDLNELLQEKQAGQQGFTSPILELTEDNFHHLQAEHKSQEKELFLLRKTLEEMELRIETQKQTLGARDESIKRLLDMLQNKDLTRSEMPNEEGLRLGRETKEQLGYLEVILEQKEEENMHLREELYQRQQTDHAKTKALHTAIDMKGPLPGALWQNSKIASLERNIRDLEDEIQMLRFSGLLNTHDKDKELKQMEAYKSHSRLMKNKDPFMHHVAFASPRANNRCHDQTYMLPQQHKMDQLKQDLSKKESEMLALQTKLETLANQNSDCKQHIEVLKESLSAKEQRASVLQSEVDALRLRLEEKETFLNKKIKQLQDLADEKSTLSGEIHDLKDMLDVKECKISVLQKKIENLLEQVRDKDKQLESLKDRVTSLQTDSRNTDTAFATLEEALAEKDKLIEQLKEHRQREVQDKNVEIEVCKTENKDLKDKITSLQAQLLEKESCLLELRERISSLTSSGLQKDSRLRALERRAEECTWLEGQLRKKALESNEAARTNVELSEQVKTLEVALQKDESACKGEAGQLQGVHREAGTEQMTEKNPEPERQDNTTPLAEIKPTNALQQVQQACVCLLTTNGPPQREELMSALDKARARTWMSQG
ncbi:ERC protein 2-like isoform X2 [Brachyhypopomus gauderio]|uniref:ERC protein 2-like isoform X2 n=1 Tax=Brachyhypopomus gauderio TaxID=698409 RepID=UPI0040438AE2